MAWLMRRRFLAGAALLAVLPRSQAQSPRRLGMLFIEPQPPEQLAYRTVAARLAELGWVEGSNLVIERAYAEADEGKLPGLAADLVRKGMDVIFADDAPSALALKRATTATPVIFVGVPWPVESGLVQSLSRPGGNLTGIATTEGMGEELTAKRVQILREIVPKAVRLARVLTSSIHATASGPSLAPAGYAQLAANAKKVGFETTFHAPGPDGDFDPVFHEILAARSEALSVGQSALLIKNRKRIADFALRHSLPGTFFDYTFVDAGGLVSYGPDFEASWRASAGYIDRCLRGAKPAEMPVELPSFVTMRINMRTARAMGLAIPASVLASANRIVD
jgi:putative ABC transport system substrate-binding protein